MTRALCLALALLGLALPLRAQEALPAPEIVVDRPPEPAGGLAALAERLRYPEAAREAGAEGTVYVSLIVEADGAPSEVTLARGVHGALDAEALRVVSESPFIPAEKGGAAVRSRTTLPLRFVLEAAPVSAPTRVVCGPSSTLSPSCLVGIEAVEGAEGSVCAAAEIVGGVGSLQLRYPEAARRRNVEGTVYAEFVINEQGRATHINVVRTPHPSFEQPVREALARADFVPATVDGIPVSSVMTLPVNFRLRDERAPRRDFRPRGGQP